MFTSYKNIRAALERGETSCVNVVKHYLKKIEAQADLNAFIEVYKDEALARAEAIDAKLAAGNAGRLAGMVVSIKDVIAHKDHGLTASSKILGGFVSQFSATAVERILSEDAIVIGRVSCDEFAMGSSNENSCYGPVKNNVDPTRVPGGSSGASAVSVSGDMCLVALGSDTGGSVRQPAAFTGIIGLKPSYSRISRWGLIAYASSFDCIGIMARHMDDVALVLEITAGDDGKDATVSRRPVPTYSEMLALDPARKLRVGYIKETVESEYLAPEIKARTLEKIEALRKAGHEVTSVDFPLLKYILPTYYILTTAEASTNLSRYDGVRYGHRTAKDVELEDMYKLTRSEGFGQEVKRRIMLGTFVLSASYYDAYFTKAQKVRRLIKEATEKMFVDHDFLLMPTTTSTAFELGKYGESNVLEMYLSDIFSVQANVVGMPAISVPNGNDAQGLPIGLQVMAAKFEEAELMAFSKYLMELQ